MALKLIFMLPLQKGIVKHSLEEVYSAICERVFVLAWSFSFCIFSPLPHLKSPLLSVFGSWAYMVVCLPGFLWLHCTVPPYMLWHNLSWEGVFPKRGWEECRQEGADFFTSMNTTPCIISSHACHHHATGTHFFLGREYYEDYPPPMKTLLWVWMSVHL